MIATEWNEFREPDFNRMRKLMKTPVIFDGRNIYSPEQMKTSASLTTPWDGNAGAERHTSRIRCCRW